MQSASATLFVVLVIAAGQMRQSTEAALVGAAMLSVVISPAIGMRSAPTGRPSATRVIDADVA